MKYPGLVHPRSTIFFTNDACRRTWTGSFVSSQLINDECQECSHSTNQIDRKHPVVFVGTHDPVQPVTRLNTHFLPPRKYGTYSLGLIILLRAITMCAELHRMFVKIWTTGSLASFFLKRTFEARMRFLIVYARLVSLALRGVWRVPLYIIWDVCLRLTLIGHGTHARYASGAVVCVMFFANLCRPRSSLEIRRSHLHVK